MVLAERNSELVRNGRRSRGPSPNGHSTGNSGNSTVSGVGGAVTETSSDDDNSIKRNGKSKSKQSEYEEKIRVGRDYQAVCPPLIPEQERKPEILNDRALLVWSPTKDIPDSKLEEYISVAKEKYGYNGEQALGMLFWHKHDLERAVMDLANFTPFPDEWTVEDKVLFEQAFQFHGKSFHRIRQMLPDKSIPSLVKYYYSWKKTRHRQSVMDRQEKAKANKEGSENGSDNGSNEESDNDDKDQTLPSTSAAAALQDQLLPKASANSGDGSSTDNKKGKANDSSCGGSGGSGSGSVGNERVTSASCSGGDHGTPVDTAASGGGSGNCTNCGVLCHVLYPSANCKLCGSCFHHWRRTGSQRPTCGPQSNRSKSDDRHQRKPPKGMYINHDDLLLLANSTEKERQEFLRKLDRDIDVLKSKVQTNKQTISALKQKNDINLDELLPPEPPVYRISPRWTSQDTGLAIECFRRYGKDFQTIATIVGTKTESHIRTFYLNNRRRHNLDQLVKEFEANKNSAAAAAAAAAAAEPVLDTETAMQQTAAAASETKPDATALSASTANLSSSVSVDNAASTSSSVNKNGVSKNQITTDESENTIFSETTNSKSTSDDIKSNSSSSQSSLRKDNIIEIDLDADQDDGPPRKKFALTAEN